MKQSKHLLFNLMAFVMAIISLTSCQHDGEELKQASLTDKYVGKLSGKLNLSIAGQYDYETDLSILISAAENETLCVSFPEYALSNTLMGDITMGQLILENLAFDSSKGGFYLDYGDKGISQYFKAERNGTAVMDSDYPLNSPSNILVTKSEDGEITIVNSFRIGAMPMPITATFTGHK